MRKFLYIVIIFFSFQNCKRELPEPADGCVPLPPEPPIGWNYILPDTGYSAPCFNPENPDEIIYREHHFTTGKLWLCKLNLKTLKKNYIFQGNFWSEPKWGKDDWIIFTLSDTNIYKIKSDGTQLTQLTFDGKGFSPVWNNNYNKIYYESKITIPDTTRHGDYEKTIGIAIDQEGKILDTISWWSSRVAFINDSIVFSYDLYGDGVNSEMVSLNINTGTRTALVKYDPNLGSPTGIIHVNNYEVLWLRKDGLFRLNILSGSVTQLKKTCNSDYYMAPTYSHQINKIILENKIKAPKGYNLEIKGNFFVMMNPDGTGEEEIKIP